MGSKRSCLIVLAAIFCVALAGCGFFDSDHDEDLAVDESVYETGHGVPAVPYDEAQTIELYRQEITDGRTSYVKIANGDYLAVSAPYTVYTLGVKVTARSKDGEVMDQRVFLGDGGWEYQVEAVYDEEWRMYVADFKFLPSDTFLTHPVLVQVIYSDGLASKEKFILHTRNDLAAASGMLVDKGLGVSLSADFLHRLAPVVSAILEEQGVGLTIADLAPADNASGGAQGVIRADLGILSCDLILDDTYTPLFGQETRALALGVEDIAGGTPDNLLELIGSAFFGLFFKDLQLQGIPIMALGFNLADLMSGLTGSDDGTNSLLSMLSGLQIDSSLFLNLYGMPAETSAGFATIGGALYAADPADVATDDDGNLLWPAVTVDATDTGIDMALLRDGQTDVGLALAQYNLNQVLPQVAKGITLTIKAIQELVPMFAPSDPDNDLDLTLTINPAGMAIEMTQTTQRIAINDIRLLFVEAGEPQAELSLDLTLNFAVSFRTDGAGAGYMDLTITPVDELCFIHVMKDNLDLVMFDHSRFVPMIFQGFSGGSDSLTVPIALSDMGIQPRTGAAPGQVQYDEHGNCFLGLAVGGLDADKLPVSGCFIAAAAY